MDSNFPLREQSAMVRVPGREGMQEERGTFPFILSPLLGRELDLEMTVENALALLKSKGACCDSNLTVVFVRTRLLADGWRVGAVMMSQVW